MITQKKKKTGGFHSKLKKEKWDSGLEKPMPKCLLMIPERLAWSLIQDGWILRNKIIWYKPNGMPSSVKDRFSNKWEYLFLFSKQQKYYFDLDAVREEYTAESKERYKYAFKENETQRQSSSQAVGAGNIEQNPIGKNPGDMFSIPTQPFPEAHFAVFPEKLCEKPIKAGCPEGGTVLDPFCGAGTTCHVAKEMGRNYIGIEISPEYIKIAEKRLRQKNLFTEVKNEKVDETFTDGPD